MRKAIAASTEVILIEDVSRRVAEVCVNQLFNLMGGITARSRSTSHEDTSFKYAVYAVKLKSAQIPIAKAFCLGVRTGLSA
jgi:hypothetical protein